MLDRIVAAARWTGRVAPAGGLILILLAASLMLRSMALDKPISADMRAESPPPGSPLIAPHALIPPPSIELPDVGLDQLRVQPAAFAQMMAQPAVKTRVQRRSPPSLRGTHAAVVRNSDAFWRPYSAHFGPAVDGNTHY
jgi:hypothetical protein